MMNTRWLALTGLLLPLLAYGEPCTVVDPELQGDYEGGCRFGLAHGDGHARGTAEYVGEFRKGKKHGHGVKTWAWGDRYVGGFKDDSRHGHGMYVWGAGSQWAGERYVGEFVADQRQGQGTYFWPNGDRFDGQWKEDLRYGLSVMEQRREVAVKERVAVLGQPGTTVCGQTEVGIGQFAAVRAQTVSLEEATLVVRISSVGATDTGLASQFKAGDTLQSNMWQWEPCL